MTDPTGDAARKVPPSQSQYQKRTLKSARWTIGVVVLATSVAASAQQGETLTNSDVTKMAQAGLSANIIVATIRAAPTVSFDLGPERLAALKGAGVSDAAIEAMVTKAYPLSTAPKPAGRVRDQVSDQFAEWKDSETVLRTFKTLWVDTSQATFFDKMELKEALVNSKDFQASRIVLVDDRKVADVILEISYVFAWDYPFVLKYQKSSAVLLSGKGTGTLSGTAGARSVASEFAKAVKPYRR